MEIDSQLKGIKQFMDIRSDTCHIIEAADMMPASVFVTILAVGSMISAELLKTAYKPLKED